MPPSGQKGKRSPWPGRQDCQWFLFGTTDHRHTFQQQCPCYQQSILKNVQKRWQQCSSVESESTLMSSLNRRKGTRTYWRFGRVTNQLITLARTACYYLAMPASSAPSERIFSSTRRVLRWDRTRLSPETLKTLSWFILPKFGIRDWIISKFPSYIDFF